MLVWAEKSSPMDLLSLTFDYEHNWIEQRIFEVILILILGFFQYKLLIDNRPKKCLSIQHHSKFHPHILKTIQ